MLAAGANPTDNHLGSDVESNAEAESQSESVKDSKLISNPIFATDQESEGNSDGIEAYVRHNLKQVSSNSVLKNDKKLKKAPKVSNGLQKTTAMLVRETKLALPIEVEKPKTLGSFLQDFALSHSNPLSSAGLAENPFKTKDWAKKLTPEQVARLGKVRPKLTASTKTCIAQTCDGSIELEIVPDSNAPRTASSQKIVDKRRERATLAPKLKKASIDELNAKLDGMIRFQKKAQKSMEPFRNNDSGNANDDNGEMNAQLRLLSRNHNKERDSEDDDEMGMAESSSEAELRSEDQADSINSTLDVAHDPRRIGPSKTYSNSKDFRRPVILEDEISESDSQRDSELLDALIEQSDGSHTESSGEEEVKISANAQFEPVVEQPGELFLIANNKQSSLMNYLSGKFPSNVNSLEKPKPTEPIQQEILEAKRKKRAMQDKKGRSMFLEEEAEEDDEDDDDAFRKDRSDEFLDEAAIEAELKASKFIAESENEDDENSGDEAPNHFAIHRELTKEDDDQQLDRVLKRFAKDKSLTESNTFLTMQQKYRQDSSEYDEDEADDVGIKARKKAPIKDATLPKRRDEALFALLQDEMSEEDDMDSHFTSYSEPDPYHDDEEIIQKLEDIEEEAEGSLNESEGPGSDELENSLGAFFTSASIQDTARLPKKTNLRPTLGIFDQQRKTKLLDETADTASYEPIAKRPANGAAFKAKN